MRPLFHVLAGMLLLVALPAVSAGATGGCTSEDFARAINDAGAALRKLSADNTPRLRAKMRALKVKRKWPDAGYEERAYRVLQDERVAELDANANTLLARIDALGTLDPAVAPDCSRLQALQAASLELQATVKTKTAYLISRIDQMLADAPIPALPKAVPADAKSDLGRTETVAKAKTGAKPEPQLDPEPPLSSPPPVVSGWSTRTTDAAPPMDTAAAQLPPAPPAGDADIEGYSIEQIKAASAGFFGQMSANLGSVIEHLFRQSGRPTAYILGTEGGGAFVAGVRYGDGTLYMRSGDTRKIYWHGPSLGADVGGAGSKTLFLIYKMKTPEDIYSTFHGIDGSAYLVGGVGVTLVTNGTVVLAPIRSGLGLRLGASVGYLRFTPRPTWNPF